MTRQYLPTEYQQFIHLSRYARFLDAEGRRETWPETVCRYFDFFEGFLTTTCPSAREGVVLARPVFESAILNLEVMPSMRALMTAGPGLARDHLAGYNCAYLAVDRISSFDEALRILMSGSGVSFSVERQFVGQLPVVPQRLSESHTVVSVDDDKDGWASALRQLLSLLYSGVIPQWDTSRLRPEGARLRTFGGRASGPRPLRELFEFTVETFHDARGRRLSSLEAHDLMCKVGETVVSGGVRRSAMLSLSNPSDLRMRDAKAGNWWEVAGHRALANNSTAYTERPEVGAFMEEWLALYRSKSGERGIFNREASLNKVASIGRAVGQDDRGLPTADLAATQTVFAFGTNPCGEVILRSRQLCNLTEVVARVTDTVKSLEQKVMVASALGTWQACLTDFPYVPDDWKNNCQEERLLGVSITGIMDSPLLNGAGRRSDRRDLLRHLRDVAVRTNREWAGILGIPVAAAVTCVKPSGTVSQLVGASSGIHRRFAPMYVRRVRQSVKDPLTAFMRDSGFPGAPDVTKPEATWVFDFPVRSPTEALCLSESDPIDELRGWLEFRKYWCDHNPSTTVFVPEHRWPSVGGFVWDHFDEVGGLTFFPQAGHTYRQAPYEAVSDSELDILEAQMPKNVDWGRLSEYEREDTSEAHREFACSGASCALPE